jgi:hypothetical protein
MKRKVIILHSRNYNSVKGLVENISTDHIRLPGHSTKAGTCTGPVVGGLVGGAVDEPPEAGDGVGAHQGVAAERPAVHHSDVQRRVEQLVLREVLQRAG